MAETAPGVVRRIVGNLGKLLCGKAAAGLLSLAYMQVGFRSALYLLEPETPAKPAKAPAKKAAAPRRAKAKAAVPA